MSVSAPGNMTETLRAVIVDDEELARVLLKEQLLAAGGVEIVAECANGFEAVKAVGELHPDLLFLDIQMPKLDGFEVLELIDPPPAVIFVTAYDQYALKAFDANAVDYLLKPFAEDRLAAALEKARALAGTERDVDHGTEGREEASLQEKVSSREKASFQEKAARVASAARPPDRPLERIVVKDGTKVHIIPIAKLDHAEAQDDYVALHSQGKAYLKQQTISSLAEQLPERQFVRVHRSHIVNVDRIERIEPYTKDSRVVVLRDGSQLPVSRSGYGNLRALLGDSV